jgi:hypothetical protein
VAKAPAVVLKPRHFIGVALILLTTLSMFFCTVNRQFCFLPGSGTYFPGLKKISKTWKNFNRNGEEGEKIKEIRNFFLVSFFTLCAVAVIFFFKTV